MSDIEPDAWQFDMKTPVGRLQKTFQTHPEESKNDFDWVKDTDEPLYSAETIEAKLEELLEKYEEGETPFDSYECSALRPFVKELKEVFSE